VAALLYALVYLVAASGKKVMNSPKFDTALPSIDALNSFTSGHLEVALQQSLAFDWL
jgi:hypothetical protein